MKRLHGLIAVAAVSAAACSGGGGGGTGRVTVRLTDAATPTVVTAVVTISKISLQGDAGETVLTRTPATVSLLALANETATLVEDAVVPAGTYQQLRFQITGGYIEVPAAGGATEIFATSPSYEGLPAGAQVAGELKMPSAAQSGIKVTMPASALVVSQDSKIMLVDFDVAQSFGHEAGGSGSWVMHPVIKGVDFTLSGNVVTTLKLADGVTLPTVNGTALTLGDFSAVLRDEGGAEETLPYADAGNGTYAATFRYLMPGPYTVEVEGTSAVTFATDPASPASVTVPEGGDAHADFTVTSAAAAAAQ